MGRRVALTVVLVAAGITLIAIYAGAPAMHNRVAFGTFDTVGAPPRVDYCGRRYYPGNKTETLAQVKAFLAENGLYGLTRIDTAPSGEPIVTNVMPPELRAHYQTSVCAMGLWVQTGPDAYVGYSLSGGP